MHENQNINKFLPLIQSLYNASKEKLGFKIHARICIIKDDENMSNPLGKTAHYSPSEHKIGLYTQGRHVKDVLRSLAHELVHHNQNCRGDFDSGAATVEGYAQEDGHLREMEREAYEQGNMIFRDWEDNLKKKGGKPLFTSTSQYVPPPSSDIGGGQLSEGENMKKKINESHLRSIIRGVLEEMFDEDLNEDEQMFKPETEDAEATILALEAEDTATELEGVGSGDNEGPMEISNPVSQKESFYPKGRNLRSKARNELNEALMKRWIKK
jgi:hypothetical protein